MIGPLVVPTQSRASLCLSPHIRAIGRVSLVDALKGILTFSLLLIQKGDDDSQKRDKVGKEREERQRREWTGVCSSLRRSGGLVIRDQQDAGHPVQRGRRGEQEQGGMATLEATNSFQQEIRNTHSTIEIQRTRILREV